MENEGLVHEYLGITIDYLIASKVVFTMFDYLQDTIIEVAEDLKITVLTILETISCSRLLMIHQACFQKTQKYSILISQDYCLQARGRGPPYKYVMHFYAHEQNHL